MEGIGIYEWKKEGKMYIGEFEDNYRNGFGILQFKNGSIFQGNWKYNRGNGLGILIKKQRVLFGIWENGK